MRSLLKYLLVSVLFVITNNLFCQSAQLQQSISRGKDLYLANCNACHMATGEGIKNVFPPLAGNKSLNDTDRLIKVIVKGIRGEITIDGAVYNMPMTAFAFSGQETADVVNYIRNSWGNKGEMVNASQIQPALKTKSANYEPY